jgi:hypothetical protein
MTRQNNHAQVVRHLLIISNSAGYRVVGCAWLYHAHRYKYRSHDEAVQTLQNPKV